MLGIILEIDLATGAKLEFSIITLQDPLFIYGIPDKFSHHDKFVSLAFLLRLGFLPSGISQGIFFLLFIASQMTSL